MSQMVLSIMLVCLSLVAFGGACVLAYILILRIARGTADTALGNEFTNHLLLLQTMRDMLDQQKELAREFNRSLDNKVSAIRKAVSAVLNEHQRLEAMQREQDRRIREVKDDLARIQHMARTIRRKTSAANLSRDDLAGPPVPPPATAPPPAAEPARDTEAVTRDAGSVQRDAAEREEPARAQDGGALNAVAQPEAVREDLIDNWTGFDFGAEEPDPVEFDVPEAPPEAPEDPEAAREAFRSLLNMVPEKKAARGKAASQAAPAEREGESPAGVEAVRTRVQEYYDAGMSVAEIARELGMGKGEVRFVLNLRRERAQGPPSSKRVGEGRYAAPPSKPPESDQDEQNMI